MREVTKSMNKVAAERAVRGTQNSEGTKLSGSP